MYLTHIHPSYIYQLPPSTLACLPRVGGRNEPRIRLEESSGEWRVGTLQHVRNRDYLAIALEEKRAVRTLSLRSVWTDSFTDEARATA